MAIDGAACLRRDADRLAPFRGHKDCFDSSRGRCCAALRIFPPRQRQQITHRTIRRLVPFLDSRHPDRALCRQPRAQGNRQIAHRREIESPLGIQRVIKLTAAVGRFPRCRHPRAQIFRRSAQHIVLGMYFQDCCPLRTRSIPRLFRAMTDDSTRQPGVPGAASLPPA